MRQLKEMGDCNVNGEYSVLVIGKVKMKRHSVGRVVVAAGLVLAVGCYTPEGRPDPWIAVLCSLISSGNIDF
jgi:hypothetical protein